MTCKEAPIRNIATASRSIRWDFSHQDRAVKRVPSRPFAPVTTTTTASTRRTSTDESSFDDDPNPAVTPRLPAGDVGPADASNHKPMMSHEEPRRRRTCTGRRLVFGPTLIRGAVLVVCVLAPWTARGQSANEPDMQNMPGMQHAAAPAPGWKWAHDASVFY